MRFLNKKPHNSWSELLLRIHAVLLWCLLRVYRHNKTCWCSRRHTRVDLCTCTCSSHWCHHLAHRGTSLCSPGLSHRSTPSFPIPTEVHLNTQHRVWPQSMGQISIKTPNPKCRLYWCLIEFIDWRYSQSCRYFRPSFANCWPSNILSGKSLPPFQSQSTEQTVCGWGGEGDVELCWRPYSAGV